MRHTWQGSPNYHEPCRGPNVWYGCMNNMRYQWRTSWKACYIQPLVPGSLGFSMPFIACFTSCRTEAMPAVRHPHITPVRYPSVSCNQPVPWIDNHATALVHASDSLVGVTQHSINLLQRLELSLGLLRVKCARRVPLTAYAWPVMQAF